MPVLLCPKIHQISVPYCILTSFFLFFLDFEHKNGVPVTVLSLKQPIVDVPRDLNGYPVHFYSLIPSKFPLQTLDLKHDLPIHTEAEPGVVPVSAIYLYVPHFAPEFRSRGVDFVGHHVLPFQNQKLPILGLESFSLGVRILVEIADQKNHLLVHNQRDVETGEGLRSGPEFGFGEIPEEESIGGKLLGSMPFPEDEGLDVEVKRSGSERSRRERGIVRGVMEVKMEGATQNGARPGEGNDAGVGVEEIGGEVGVGG